MNYPQDLLEATYRGTVDGVCATYNPAILVGMVRYYAKQHYSPGHFKLFTFSWELGRAFTHLARNGQ